MRKTHLVAILGGFAMLVTVTSPAVAQVDPFYSRLLEDGSRELSIDRYEEAVADLRLACFGFLDEPAVLIRGLALLAVAQEGANESVELQRTLDRVLEVEERFQVYGEASLPEGMTERFERLLLALVSEARIGAIPAFSELAEREQARLVSKPVAQVDDQHVDEDSADPLTILAVARADLERGKKKRALRRLDELVKAHPGFQEARCLRFQANAALRNCEAMVGDLSSCWPWPESPEEVRSQLQCLVERREWSTARDLVASLEPEVADEAQIDMLLAEIAKKAPPGTADPEDRAGPTRMAETGEVATEPLNDPEESPQLAAAVPEPSPSERRTLAEASIVVESASDLEEIEEYLEPKTAGRARPRMAAV